MKLLVTGARGLLGSEVVASAPDRGHEVVGTGRDELDITDPVVAERVVGTVRPDAVIQCAGYTVVDPAESEPEVAMRVNRDGARIVAEVGHRLGARFVYLSTDYVFDGEQGTPYRPDDRTNPLSAYGRSKRAGEVASFEASESSLVVRTSWLYGAARPNFVTKMVDRGRLGEPLTVVDDQTGCPSWARNVAQTVLELAERGASGVWHAADRGECTWADLAREALRLAGVDTPVAGVSSAEWGAPAPRPRYSVLDVSVTEGYLGRELMDWRDSLEAFMTGEHPHGEEGR